MFGIKVKCDQNLHAHTTVKHSEVYTYSAVPTTVKKNSCDKMSDYLKSLGMLLQYLLNKPHEITGFSHPIFFEEKNIFYPLVYYC